MVGITDWIVLTVGKRVVAEKATRRNKSIRIEEPADFGIVISTLQIIEPGLCGAGAAKLGHSYMIHTPQRGISYGE